MFRIFPVLTLLLLASCANDPLPVDCTKSDLLLELVQTVPASGCGVSDGHIKISATGGSGGYQFAVLNGVFQSSGDFNTLAPGIYAFVVRDKSNCEAMLSNVTLMASDISFTADVVDNTMCVGGNGSITIHLDGGQAPYQYKILKGDYDDENLFTDLESGNYPITVKDNAACIVTLTVTVGQGVTNTSWSTDILPIMENSCALNGCHNGGNPDHSDLRVYSNAKFYATLIKTYTQDGSMPFEGTITQAQKDLIACWVDEGALDN